ncbi:aromatic-amino-acid transaminase [Pseudomonas vancouverensis]|uniref:Aspartate/tyrosine/aromatic aminotransferase n=1 Tax=Pseudomonas vancouverensis TaxID=95300 RepID=A0A1H2MD94_PSEVA|nr:aspartate/tyrosine/aromatic aminotransferase [Pseudomonas vancouverensis]TDB57832.1 aspartate/tyrosine/aromatic aminotransferase [Pseudomonas vancouverensis]SDU91193.1 aromatic-amino-acid transaminase [Pseudomonas vancouverensis]
MPIFQNIQVLPNDPILGLADTYARDIRSKKIDLGIGVYKDSSGKTPVLASVLAAEKWLLENQITKAYVGSEGLPQFNQAILSLVFGEDARLSDRYAAVQTPGGTGALRLMAEFLRRTAVQNILIQVPTWTIHEEIFKRAGLHVQTCQHLTDDGDFNAGALLTALEALSPGDAVLLHACCHNPTGIDPDKDQWRSILEVVSRKGLLPLFDMAYQGFGAGLEEDTWALRLFCDELPEVIASISCSKNVGIYRERTGALLISCAEHLVLEAVKSQIIDTARCLWSMPPAHGGAVVAHILTIPALTELWRQEVLEMGERIKMLRNGLCAELRKIDAYQAFSSIESQKGMFSFLNRTPGYVQHLRESSAIYMVGNGRINISGLPFDRLDEVAVALKSGLSGGRV